MNRKPIKKSTKSTIVHYRLIFLLVIITFCKCECPIQCCPEEKITQIEIHVSPNSSSCISSCKMIKPYLLLNGNHINLSSSSDGCQWLNKSLSRYSDSLLTLGINISDTNLILLDTLRLESETIRTLDIAINGIGSYTTRTPVKTVYINCINAIDTILVFDNESECNECNN